jgi:hypothetical protein
MTASSGPSSRAFQLTLSAFLFATLLVTCVGGGLHVASEAANVFVTVAHSSFPILPDNIEALCPNIDTVLSQQIMSYGGLLSKPANDVLLDHSWLVAILFSCLGLFGYAFYRTLRILFTRLLPNVPEISKQTTVGAGAVLLASIIGELSLHDAFTAAAASGWEVGINHAARSSFILFAVSASLLAATHIVDRPVENGTTGSARLALLFVGPAVCYLIATALSPRIDLFQDYGNRIVFDPILHFGKTYDKNAVAIATQVPGEGQGDGAVDVVVWAFSPIACRQSRSHESTFHFGAAKLRPGGYLVPRIAAPTFEVTSLNDSPSSLSQVATFGVEWAWRLRSNDKGSHNVRISVYQVQRLSATNSFLEDPVELMWSDFGVDMRGSIVSWDQIAGFLSWLGALIGTIIGVTVGISKARGSHRRLPKV